MFHDERMNRELILWVLRMVVVLGLSLNSEVRRWLAQQNGDIHFPFVNLGIADWPYLQVVVYGFWLLGLLLMMADQLVVVGAFFAASANLLWLTQAPEFGYQFVYLTPFCILALGLSVVLWRRNSTKSLASLPFTALLTTLYAYSALHKFLNRENLLWELPASIFEIGDKALNLICSDPSCLLLKMAALSVVPVEILMAILSLGPRFSRARILMISLFHFAVSVFAFKVVWMVSVSMLSVHLLLLFFERGHNYNLMFEKRQWRFFFCGEIVLLALTVLCASFSEAYPPLAFGWALFGTASSQFPFWFLFAGILRKSSPVTEPTPKLHQRKLMPETFALGIYIVIVLAFGLIPFMTTPHYALDAPGWTQFSGRSRKGQAFELRTPADDCHKYRLHPTIGFVKTLDNSFIYKTYLETHQARLKKLFLERCATNFASPPRQ